VKKFNGESEQESVEVAVGLLKQPKLRFTVHKFPAVARTTEVHLVPAKDSVALRPMTWRKPSKKRTPRPDVFVFRDPKVR